MEWIWFFGMELKTAVGTSTFIMTFTGTAFMVMTAEGWLPVVITSVVSHSILDYLLRLMVY